MTVIFILILFVLDSRIAWTFNMNIIYKTFTVDVNIICDVFFLFDSN